MGVTLHFGVNDIPYGRGSTTTGDVAEILERRYKVMETYYEVRGDFVRQALEDALQGKLDNLLMGGQSVVGDLFEAGDLSAVEQDFRRFLDERGMDGRVPGVPTAAAQAGVNPRLLHPYARSNPPRPSFIARGEYQANFRAWVD